MARRRSRREWRREFRNGKWRWRRIRHVKRLSEEEVLANLVHLRLLKGQVDPPIDLREPDGVRCRPPAILMEGERMADPPAFIRPSLLEPLGWNYDDMAEGEALTFLEETEWLRELPRMGPTGVAGAAFGARDQFNLVAHREALKRCRERRRRGSVG